MPNLLHGCWGLKLESLFSYNKHTTNRDFKIRVGHMDHATRGIRMKQLRLSMLKTWKSQKLRLESYPKDWQDYD